MRGLIESFAVLLGRDPKPPARFTPEAQEIHDRRRGTKNPEIVEYVKRIRAGNSPASNKWRNWRWATLLAVNLLFVVSYRLDIQILEGSLTASRFLGFHMADLNSALQVMLAFKKVLINLLIGAVTVFVLCLLGGRTFCAWICPYHLLGEWAEMLHVRLATKKWIRDHPFERRARVWLWLTFSVLAFVTGYTVYETISPTGIVSRALIYGPGVAFAWVIAVLLFEVFYSRRAWCRYACPIGLTYGLVGVAAPLKVKYDLTDCHHDGACRQVCMVPHVLDVTKRKRAEDVSVDIGADCTRCGMCVDACPTSALKFTVKGLGNLF